jgi:hypothetical protein
VMRFVSRPAGVSVEATGPSHWKACGSRFRHDINPAMKIII